MPFTVWTDHKSETEVFADSELIVASGLSNRADAETIATNIREIFTPNGRVWVEAD